MIIKKLMILNALIKNVIYLELKIQFYHVWVESLSEDVENVFKSDFP